MSIEPQVQEVFCQQVLVEDSSVFSIQWMLYPALPATSLTPATLLDRYLNYIRCCTAGIIRPVSTVNGVDFRLFGSRFSLISFLSPIADEIAVTLRICGGLLVQSRRSGRGELRLSVDDAEEGLKITLQLSDYFPLILGSQPPTVVRRWFYRVTQAAVHRLVTIRFLAVLYRDLVAPTVRIRVTSARIREGRPV